MEAFHKIIVVTTSWDDGYPFDLKLAELLAKYGLTGTFYIPIKNKEHKVVDKIAIREISEKFEVGSHTLNHRILTHLPREDVKKEVQVSKEELSNIIGRNVSMLSYPKGKYNKKVMELVREANYIGARTNWWFNIKPPKNPFLIHPTSHVFPHTRFVNIKHSMSTKNWAGLITYLNQLRLDANWRNQAMRLFDSVLEIGGVWHLWGHSWEIEENNLWKELQTVLKYVANHNEVTYCTNSELLELMDIIL